MTAKEIIIDLMNGHHVLDPHTLSLDNENISYAEWCRTLDSMWCADEMPGYTIEYGRSGRVIYYYVGKRKRFNFNWLSLLNFWRK